MSKIPPLVTGATQPTPPVTAAELEKAAARLRASKEQGSAAPDRYQQGGESQPTSTRRPSPEALGALRALAHKYGKIQDLDVEALARTLGEKAATGLRQLYTAVKRLKVQGELVVPREVDRISDEILTALRAGKVAPRLRGQLQRLARQEILTLTGPSNADTALRQLVRDNAASALHARLAEPRGGEIDLPYLEQDRRLSNALVVVVMDPLADAALRRACVQRLGRCGDAQAREVIAALRDAEAGKPGSDAALIAACQRAIEQIDKASHLRIAQLTFESKPFVSGGGLGNVMQEIPPALRKLGHEPRVFMPRHAATKRSEFDDKPIAQLEIPHPNGDQRAAVLEAERNGVAYCAIDNEAYFSAHRKGVYDAGPYHDNAVRFDFGGKAALEAIRQVYGDQPPDVLEINDAHLASAAVYARQDPTYKDYFAHTKIVFRPHNLGGAVYQQVFGAEEIKRLGLKELGVFFPRPDNPAEWVGTAAQNGLLNFAKMGMEQADLVTTVSRHYARELRHPKNGQDLTGLMASYAVRGKLTGVINGIDGSVWNPETDPAIAAHYSFLELEGKAACKAALQARYGLPAKPDVPVMGAVSRITDQKGFDEVVAAVEHAMASDREPKPQFILCGERASGQPEIVAQLDALAERFPDNVRYDGDFDQGKERQIHAGSDFFLMPSIFEPCGLPQMYALRYLTIPVVADVGGLHDTVQPYDPETGVGNGFRYDREAGGTIQQALDQALDWYARPPADRKELLRNAALSDNTWDAAAAELIACYRRMFA